MSNGVHANRATEQDHSKGTSAVVEIVNISNVRPEAIPIGFLEFDSDIYIENLSLPEVSGAEDIFRKVAIPRVQECLIRCLDVMGSLGLLILFFPLLLLTGVLVKASSPGPVFYQQRRVGKNGRNFDLFKFRSMVSDAEKEIGPVFASPEDERVTWIGRLIRKTRIDELPQLFNVMRGDMSLVGPRPERPFFVAQHAALRGIRLSVRPGLTGLAQIRGYYDLKPNHKLKYDYLYIQNRSFLLNLYILAKTVPVIISKSGW